MCKVSALQRQYLLKKNNTKRALAGKLHWLKHHLAHQKDVGSISDQGTYLGCEFDPRLGCVQEATDQHFSTTSLSLSLPPSLCYSFSQLLKINEHVLR